MSDLVNKQRKYTGSSLVSGNALAHKKCVPCEGGVSPFTSEQTAQYKKQIVDIWEVVEDGHKIKAKFKFKDFKEAMVFVNKVAEVAEQEQHHPDIKIFYSIVEITLWTHAIAGLSENDFIVAAKIDRILNHESPIKK